jgi:4-amino-4-deoxy-L-arabinose transferase-like glycosyltransferase
MLKLEHRWLVAIIVIAVILRLASSIYMGNQVTNLPGVYDQISYDKLAQRVLTGHGFSFGQPWWPLTEANAPTAHWSFLYTLYLVAVYSLFGITPLAARIIQAVLAGILMPLLIYRLGNRVFGPVLGLVAAAISAIYVYFFYYAASLMTETFFILGILWSIDIAISIRYTQNPRTRQWLILGLVMTITVLLRQTFLPVIGLIGLWLWYAAKGARLQMGKGFALSIIILIVGIAPWTIRNYRVFHQFVLLNTNAGYAFYWANHPIFGTNFSNELPEGVTWASMIPQELHGMDEASLEKELMRRSIQTILNDPGRYLLLSLSRIKEQFKFWPTTKSPLISNISRLGSFGLFLPFMGYGTWLVIFRCKRFKYFDEFNLDGKFSRISAWLKTSVALWLGFFSLYTVIHILSWAAIRYRLPTDAVMIIFAAVGIDDLYHRFAIKFDHREKISSRIVVQKKVLQDTHIIYPP